MRDLPFLLLYLACLLGCVGVVETGRYLVGRVPEFESARPIEVFVAVPPKPVTEMKSAATGAGLPGAGSTLLYDEAGCRQRSGDFKDVCFQTLALQRALRDLEGAMDACGEVSRERLLYECLGDVAQAHVRSSLEESLAVCRRIPRKKWMDQCYFGLSVALSEDRPEEALGNCERAGMWRDYCRHDVLGQVATYDLEFVLETCGREEGDILSRKTCWHGLGKYIGRKNLDDAFAACRRVPLGPGGLYRQNCVHGAGWAAGEKSGYAAATRCGEAGAERDSCLLGVAYSIKRLDAQAAIALCGDVTDSGLRRHCQEHLSR